MSKRLYYPPDGESWANIVEKDDESRGRDRGRSLTRSRSGSRSRSLSRKPERGNMKMNNGHMMIYSRKGKWVPAINEYSNYGGPYSNIEDLERNPRYISDMANIYTARTEGRVKNTTSGKKIMQPCKFLYSCKGTPGKPTTRGISSECWAFEYKDPITGEIRKPRVCDRLHPGEPGWRSEWARNRTFKARGGARKTRRN